MEGGPYESTSNPAVMPLGYQRGRMVYVSQLRYVMERPVMVDARCA